MSPKLFGTFAYLSYFFFALPNVLAFWSFYDCVARNLGICGGVVFWLPITYACLIVGIFAGLLFSVIAGLLGTRDWFLLVVPLSCIVAFATPFLVMDPKGEIALLLSAAYILFLVAILGWRIVTAMIGIVLRNSEMGARHRL